MYWLKKCIGIGKVWREKPSSNSSLNDFSLIYHLTYLLAYHIDILVRYKII